MILSISLLVSPVAGSPVRAAAGDVDNGWAGSGTASIPTPVVGVDATYADVVALPGGKVLAAGLDTAVPRIIISRFLADGTPDPTCDGDGTYLDVSGRAANALAVKAMRDGRFVVFGIYDDLNNIPPSGLIARFTADCRPDPTFGDGGFLRVVRDQGVTFLDGELASNGSIVAAGSTVVGPASASDPGTRWLVAKFSSSGAPVTTFGDGGIWVSGASHMGVINGVSLDASGRVVFVAASLGSDTGPSRVVVGRLNKNGRLDRTFGRGGTFTDTAGGSLFPTDILTRADGSAVVSAVARPSGEPGSGFIVCVTSAGRPDRKCGRKGLRAVPGISGGDHYLSAITSDRAGRILVSGSIYVGGSFVSMTARFTARGAFDRTFGQSGVILRYSGFTIPRGITVQANGRILLAGGAVETGTQLKPSVSRLMG